MPPHPLINSLEAVQFEHTHSSSPESCFGALQLLVLACRSLTFLKTVLILETVDKDFLLKCSSRFVTWGASLILLFSAQLPLFPSRTFAYFSTVRKGNLYAQQKRREEKQETSNPSTLEPCFGGAKVCGYRSHLPYLEVSKLSDQQIFSWARCGHVCKNRYHVM